jgi:hypothetical protein
MRAVGRFVRALAWLVVAVGLALGAGGVVVAADRPPGDATRPELTARADRAVAARLDELRDEIDAIDRDVESLGATGRAALVELADRDVDGLLDRLEVGDAIVDRITTAAAQVRRVLRDLPYPAESPRIGERTRQRIETMERLVDGTAPLRESWSALVARSQPAAQLIGLLQEHDVHTVAAARFGTEERYADALAELEESFVALERAQEVRDDLAPTVDVSTLDLWLDRSRVYDSALQELYQILVESEGVFTEEARDAFENVQRVQRLLPPDTRALVVIMADIAQGGLNQSVIAIETARGTVASARAALD